MSRILDETKDEIEALYELGVVSQSEYRKVVKLTARDIEIPAPVAYEGDQIIAIRKQLQCSQTVFADILGVTADTISKWERNVRKPEKIACRLLKILEKDGIAAIS